MPYIEKKIGRCLFVFTYMNSRRLFNKTTEVCVGNGFRYHFNINNIKGSITRVRYSSFLETVLTIDSDHNYYDLRDELLKLK